MLKYINVIRPQGGKEDSVVVNTSEVLYSKLTKDHVLILLKGDFPQRVNEKSGRFYTEGEIWLPKDTRIFEFLTNDEKTLDVMA